MLRSRRLPQWKALVWHGKEDIRYDTVSDPEIEDARDAVIKVTSCATCGSDLHLYHNFIPAMLPGDVMGHETMGEIVELGPEAKSRGNLSIGDRVVIPFTIICGECDQCKKGNFSVCQRTNRKAHLAEKVFGHPTAGLFGYTHLTGGYAGGQAEFLRVPFADATHIKSVSRVCFVILDLVTLIETALDPERFAWLARSSAAARLRHGGELMLKTLEIGLPNPGRARGEQSVQPDRTTAQFRASCDELEHAALAAKVPDSGRYMTERNRWEPRVLSVAPVLGYTINDVISGRGES